MANKIDMTLVKTLAVMVRKEKKINGFKKRVRVRGKIIKKALTKNGNRMLIIQKGQDKYNFIVMKSHKDTFALADKLTKGSLIYAEGVNRFRAIICTKLKQIQSIDKSRQTTLASE